MKKNNLINISLGWVILTLLLSGCAHIDDQYFKYPLNSYSSPDYNIESNWAALPTMADFADSTPSYQFEDNQLEAEVDVFFIHPTTFRSKKKWNASMKKGLLNWTTDRTSIKHQASVFNGSCKVYAPRYRQATIQAYFSKSDRANKAFELAYNDVKAAFLKYLEVYNNGRPFILAGHSQGSSHLISLLMEFEETEVVQNQMITAYIVGMPVFEDYFKELKPCENATETGCYNAWSTYLNGYFPADYYKGAVSTNPLNWKINSEYASYEENKGGLAFRYKRKPKLYMVDAKNVDGVVWVKKPNYWMSKMIKVKNFHIADYNFFWVNIRENIADRIAAFDEENALK